MSARLCLAVVTAALIPATSIAWLGRDMPQLSAEHDASIYLVCAKSLAEGKGHRIASLPGEPPQTKYPPLYPLVLSLVWRVAPRFPENLPMLTALGWVFLPCYLLLTWMLAKKLGLGPKYGVAACVLLALNPYVILYTISAMSELPYSCVLLACLLAAAKASEPGAKWWAGPAAGALGAIGYLTRSAAVPLLASVPLVLIWRGRKARAGLFLVGMLPAVVAWSLWVRGHLAHSTDPMWLYYTDYFRYHLATFSVSDLPMIAVKNLTAMVPGIGGIFLLGGVELALVRGLFVCVGIAAVAGTVLLAVRRGVSHFHAYAVLYLAMLLPWEMSGPERVQRLLFPLLPLVVVGLTYGIGSATAWLRCRYRSGDSAATVYAPLALVGMGATALVALFTTLVMVFHFPGFIDFSRQELAAARQDFQWISQNTPETSAMLSDADPVIYLYTGRHCIGRIMPPRMIYLDDRQGLARFVSESGEYARAHGIDYAVITKTEGRRFLGGEVTVVPPELRLVHDGPKLAVYATR